MCNDKADTENVGGSRKKIPYILNLNSRCEQCTSCFSKSTSDKDPIWQQAGWKVQYQFQGSKPSSDLPQVTFSNIMC